VACGRASGSGEIEVSSVGARPRLTTGSGDVWLGAVQSDVRVRTGSGDLTVADAACGYVELATGSGEIRVGVRSGTPRWWICGPAPAGTQ